jgi:hypothetical protein
MFRDWRNRDHPGIQQAIDDDREHRRARGSDAALGSFATATAPGQAMCDQLNLASPQNNNFEYQENFHGPIYPRCL